MGSSTSGYCLTGSVSGSPVCVSVPPDGLEIGRSHTCGLTVADPAASRFHCVVRFDGRKVTVENKSQNGTQVNGKWIDDVAEIRPGDVLIVGTTEFKLREDDLKTIPAVRGTAPDPPEGEPRGEAPSLKPGDMVDRYRIVRLIGKGGMGTVYEAVHTGLDLPRALKVLTLPDGPAYTAFRDKFLDEGKMLARLRHENITQVHDAAFDEKTRSLFFAMDLVLYDDGRPCTLADVAYDECDVSAWFVSLASALDYIHGQGIVHSDIKLENVLVSPGQKIKLADFGVAHLVSGKMRSALRGDAEASSDKMIGFTAHYVAPEILKNNALPSAASDAYAFGVLLVRLLTGKWYDEHPSALAEIAAKRSLNWRPVLVQLLSANPKMRPTSLVKLVQQLRHGSKSGIRRKYQIENRRRRNQKIRLQRMTHKTTQNLQPTAFAQDSRRAGIFRWSALALAALAVVAGSVWVNRANARKAREEEKRLEALADAKATAGGALRSAGSWFEGAERQIAAETGGHLREYGFVGGLSYANVTGSTDRAMAELRNDTILKYAEVLKAIGSVRAAEDGFRRACDRFDETFRPCTKAEAVKAAVTDFTARRKAAADALGAACEAERRSWAAYGEAKALIAAEGEARDAFRRERDRLLASVRPLFGEEDSLKTEPERAEAKGNVEKGDRLALASSPDRAAALRCYADAVRCLSNACARLKSERTERSAIVDEFSRSEEDLKTAIVPGFRRGQSSLAVVAGHAKAVSDRFLAKWDAGSMCPSNRALLAEHAFPLQAYSDYFDYLAKTLPGHRDGLAFALTPNGISVSNGRFPYQLGWNEVFSAKRMDIKIKDRFRRKILELCDVPGDRKPSARLLFGRWVVLQQLMPALNTDAQAGRLVEAVSLDGTAEAMICARREIPERFFVRPAPADETVTNAVTNAVAEAGTEAEEASEAETEETSEEASQEASQETADESQDESADDAGQPKKKARKRKKAPAKVAAKDEPTDDGDAPADEKRESAKEEEPVAVETDPADFVKDLPPLPVDVRQERVLFFHPLQGLNVSALGQNGVEIARCQRLKDSHRFRFEFRDGVAFLTGGGARQPRVDVEEGVSFDVGPSEGAWATCSYALVAWIDNALGDGRALVLVRCRGRAE